MRFRLFWWGICDLTKGRSVSMTLLIEDYALIGNNAKAARRWPAASS